MSALVSLANPPVADSGSQLFELEKISPPDRARDNAAASCPGTPRGGVRARLTTPAPDFAGDLNTRPGELRRSELALAASLMRVCADFRSGLRSALSADNGGAHRGPTPWMLRGDTPLTTVLTRGPLEGERRCESTGRFDRPPSLLLLALVLRGVRLPLALPVCLGRDAFGLFLAEGVPTRRLCSDHFFFVRGVDCEPIEPSRFAHQLQNSSNNTSPAPSLSHSANAAWASSGVSCIPIASQPATNSTEFSLRS
jgi:hypothetical protein